MMDLSHYQLCVLVLVSESGVLLAPLARASSPHEAMVVREAFASATRATVRPYQTNFWLSVVPTLRRTATRNLVRGNRIFAPFS
jgi:hypothetical protein